MRQLFIVLLFFILSLLGLVALFNTITNTSKQSNIALATQLPKYPNAEKRLLRALQWSTSNSQTGRKQLEDFHQWLQQVYPALFNNPNIEWQEFGAGNWVAKWIGRNADLAPIVWMASPQIPTSPPSTSTTEICRQSGKTAMLAMLEVLHAFVQKEHLPTRTIYFAFPFPAQAGEEKILNALAQAGTPVEYILQTGGFVAENLLGELSAPTALLGVGQLAKAKIKIIKKKPNVSWNSFLNRLQIQLATRDLSHEAAQQLLNYVSPELSFKERFIFSNSWLLNWGQDHYFGSGSLPQHLVGVSAQLVSTDSDTTLLEITAPQLNKTLLNTTKNWLTNDSVIIKGTWQWQEGAATADIESRSYRLLGNTCKEIFPNLITAPIWVARDGKPLQISTKTPLFFFQPIVKNATSWSSTSSTSQACTAQQNYTQILQFYHQLLSNSF